MRALELSFGMEDAEATSRQRKRTLKELQMANERDDEDQTEPSAEVEQVRNDADKSPEDSEDLEKVKDDEWMDDRFQATDN
jgi:hypothetical protein